MNDLHLMAIDRSISSINTFIIGNQSRVTNREKVIEFFTREFPVYVRDLLMLYNPHNLLKSDARTMFRAVNPHLTTLEQGRGGKLSRATIEAEAAAIGDYFDEVQKAAIIAMHTTGTITIKP